MHQSNTTLSSWQTHKQLESPSSAHRLLYPQRDVLPVSPSLLSCPLSASTAEGYPGCPAVAVVPSTGSIRKAALMPGVRPAHTRQRHTQQQGKRMGVVRSWLAGNDVACPASTSTSMHDKAEYHSQQRQTQSITPVYPVSPAPHKSQTHLQSAVLQSCLPCCVQQHPCCRDQACR